MLRQLISKWGVMSIEMQSAIDSDMAVINEDGTKDYVDNELDVIDAEVVEVQEPKTESSVKEVNQVNDATAALFGN
jgi:recombination protein RecT